MQFVGQGRPEKYASEDSPNYPLRRAKLDWYNKNIKISVKIIPLVVN